MKTVIKFDLIFDFYVEFMHWILKLFRGGDSKEMKILLYFRQFSLSTSKHNMCIDFFSFVSAKTIYVYRYRLDISTATHRFCLVCQKMNTKKNTKK